MAENFLLSTKPGTSDTHLAQSQTTLRSEEGCGICCYHTYFGFHLLGKPLDPNLRSEWKDGVRSISRDVFPILPQWARLIWVITQTILVLASVSVAVAAYATRDSNATYHIVQLIVLAIAAFASIVDLLGVLGSLILTDLYHLITYTDPIRNVAIELLLYPAVICSLMDTIQNETYKFSSGSDYPSFVTAILTGVLFTFSVYIVRLVLGGVAIIHILKGVDGAGCSGRCFLLGLFINLVAQITVQICLFFLIGIRFQAENDDSETDDLSPFLWTMIILGEVIPLAGIFAYFITTHKCMEDLPLGTLSEERHLNCLHPCVSPVQIVFCVIFTCLVIVFFASFALRIDAGEIQVLSDSGFYNISPGSAYFVIVIALFLGGVSITFIANCFPISTGVFCFCAMIVAGVLLVLICAVIVSVALAVLAFAMAGGIVVIIFIVVLLVLLHRHRNTERGE